MARLKDRLMDARLARSLAILIIVTLALYALTAVAFHHLFATQIGEVRNLAYSPEGQHIDSWQTFRPTPIQPGVKVAAAAMLFLCAISLLLSWLNLVAWVWQAASKAMMPVLLWTLLAFFGHVPALVLFLVVRSLTRRHCPQCSGWTGRKDNCCMVCGHAFTRKCPACEADCPEEAKYCPKCGKKLDE